jgi:hypothetical protein
LPDQSENETVFDKNVLEQMQRHLSAMACTIFTSDARIPRYLMKTGLALTMQSARILQGAVPEHESRSVWQEFQNKLEAFYLFEHVDSALDIDPSSTNFSLPELLNQASALGRYYSVWAVEGLGHYYTHLSLQRNNLPTGLLQDSVARDLPNSSILPLHAGLGLSLAEFLFARTDDYQTGVECFIKACRRNSREGYVGVAYEALGFVCRNLYPGLVSSIHRHLSESNNELLPYFWHGVGRAIYFSPLNVLPCRSAPWAGIEMCMTESPEALAHRNALAGFAWAMTLVNIRHPEIIALLLEHHGSTMTEADAFINGVYSAAIAWQDSDPQDRYLDALCRYQPMLTDICRRAIWTRYIQQPCRQAQRVYKSLSDAELIGTIFRV